MSGLNLELVTNYEGDLQIAHGNGRCYIVRVFDDGYFDHMRELNSHDLKTLLTAHLKEGRK